MTLTDGIKCPAADAAVVWCNHCQPRKRGVYQRGRLQRTPAPSHILTGQRSYTDERERPSKRFGLMQGSRRATSRSGGGYGLWPATALQQTSPHCRRNLNPCAEKVRAHRARHFFGGVLKAADMKSVRPSSARCGIAQPRQNKGAASLTKAHGAFRKIGEAVNRQGTLTITGSNVRLGTEMPVALSLF